jgi:hypothetical protein
MRRVVTAVALLLCLASIVAAGFAPSGRSQAFLFDFRSFYCGAQTLLAGRDPYREEPLRSCERRVTFDPVQGDTVLPDPLPPYAATLFAPLGRLPYSTASAVWLAILLSTIVVAIVAVHRLTGYSYALVSGALAATSIFSLCIGQLAPVPIAAICLAAYFVRMQRPWIAALCGAIALVEPHVGLAAFVGAMLVPRARIPFLVLGGAFVLSTFVLPIGTNVEYLTQVLSGHVQSELGSRYQYSLSAVLFAFGLPARTSMLLGSVSFVVMLVTGILAARSYVRRYGDPAFAILLPPAFVVFAGAFVHSTQIQIAVPACLLLLSHLKQRNFVLVSAVLLLITMWLIAGGQTYFAIAFALAALIVAYELLDSLPAALAVGVATLLPLLAAGNFVPYDRVIAPIAAPHYPGALAEVAWSDFVRLNFWNTPATWLLKFPTWLGQVLLILGALLSLKNRRPAGGAGASLQG